MLIAQNLFLSLPYTIGLAGCQTYIKAAEEVACATVVEILLTRSSWFGAFLLVRFNNRECQARLKASDLMDLPDCFEC